MNKDAKLKYKHDFATLTQLLNSFDLCGLIRGGAPEDEYNCLTEKLLSSVYNGRTREEMQELIVHEMEHHFGSPDETRLTETGRKKFNKKIEELINEIEEKFTGH